VEIFVMSTYRIFLRITWWNNFENWSTYAKVIVKHQTAFLEHGVVFAASLHENIPQTNTGW